MPGSLGTDHASPPRKLIESARTLVLFFDIVGVERVGASVGATSKEVATITMVITNCEPPSSGHPGSRAVDDDRQPMTLAADVELVEER